MLLLGWSLLGKTTSTGLASASLQACFQLPVLSPSFLRPLLHSPRCPPFSHSCALALVLGSTFPGLETPGSDAGANRESVGWNLEWSDPRPRAPFGEERPQISLDVFGWKFHKDSRWNFISRWKWQNSTEIELNEQIYVACLGRWPAYGELYKHLELSRSLWKYTFQHWSCLYIFQNPWKWVPEPGFVHSTSLLSPV